MQGLSKQNIRIVTETIDQSGISFSHLREDLIDHVCCEIEERLEEGDSFSHAFNSIKQDLGIKSLQQVQEKTLLLIDKNYSVMKTTMKISGVSSVILLIVGSLFKINHWPMANILLILGFTILCLLFLPSAYYIMHKEGKDGKLLSLYISAFLGSLGFFLGILFKIVHWPGADILFSAGAVIICFLVLPLLVRYLNRKSSDLREKRAHLLGLVAGMLFMAGILFKFMHWPGGVLLQTVSALTFGILFIPFYTYVRYLKSKTVEASFIYIIVAISWLGMFAMMISISQFQNVFKGFESSMHQLQYQNSEIKERNLGLYAHVPDSIRNPRIERIKNITADLYSYIDSLKYEILQNVDPANVDAINSEGDVDLRKINHAGNTTAPSEVLLGDNNSGEAYKLKKKINELHDELVKMVDGDKNASAIISTCLSTSIPEHGPEWGRSWEQLWFSQASLMGSLEILTAIQRNLNIAENEVISYLLNI